MSDRQRLPVVTGLERFLREGHPALDGKRAGLITNPSGIDRNLRSTIDRLHQSDRLKLVALFGPEHGIRGDAQAGAPVASTTDRRSGLPVYSLYGETHAPAPEMLAGLDALIFDIQDIGVRYATYLSTLVAAQEAAAAAGIPVVVFDRPNPLTGERIEGNVLDPAFTSFVGAAPLPICHGLTLGEAARFVAAERGWPEPVVIPLRGWRRDDWYDETGLPWVLPSPNLPTLDSVTLYPGTCLVEGTNISEGRGTTRPFELIGSPQIDPEALAENMERRDCPGVGFRPVSFIPTFSKHAGEVCGGVQIHILDREVLRPVALGLHLLAALRETDPGFAWRQSAHGPFFIDRLCGSDRPRLALDAGVDPGDLIAEWQADAESFREQRRPYLLYGGDGDRE